MGKVKSLLLILVLIVTCYGVDWKADSVLNVQLHFACNTIRHSDQYTTLYWNYSTWIDIRQFPDDFGQYRVVVHMPERKQEYAEINTITDKTKGPFHISTLKKIVRMVNDNSDLESLFKSISNRDPNRYSVYDSN